MSTADATALLPSHWLTEIARLDQTAPPHSTDRTADWAAALPRLVAEVLDEWGLTPQAPGWGGRTSVVVPVVRDDLPLALKLTRPGPGATAEPLALRLWDGQGAVRLVAAHPSRGVLLLERLDPARSLADPVIDTDTACEVIGGLLSRLHVPAPPNLTTLPRALAGHLHGPAGLDRVDGRLPRRAVERALGLADDLLARPDADRTVLHTDLHYGHVLAGEREPWLAIDPEPLAGHPGYELHPLLTHRVDELGTGAALRWSVRHRLELVCGAAGIDEDLARWWTIVRATVAAHLAERPEQVSLQLALAKALDD